VTVGRTAVRRDLIVAAAAKHGLPAVYPYRYYASDGGLISYGPDTIEPYLRAAGHVDRIFKKARSLPIYPCRHRQSTTSRSPQDREGARIDRSPSLLAHADEVIE
jgi:putative ABC transport system substrate-binding protein